MKNIATCGGRGDLFSTRAMARGYEGGAPVEGTANELDRCIPGSTRHHCP